MKKTLIVVLCVVLAVLMVSCTQTPAASSEPAASESVAATSEAPSEMESASEEAAGSDGLVGISVPKAPTGWVAAVQYFAKQEADELGLNYKLVASENTNEQANQIDELIGLGCEVIVLFPHNDELAVAAQKVMDAGIPLINFDRTINPATPTYYLAGDNYSMGVIGAEYINEKLGGEGKVVICGVPSYGDAVNGERIQGFKDTIAEIAPDIEIIGEYGSENASPEAALVTMTDVLTANPQIDGIYSIDDELDVGLLQAIKEANRDDIKVMTGGGGAQVWFEKMLENPDMALSSQLYSPLMIKDCVDMAQKVLNGEEVPAETIIPSMTVDITNVEEYLDPNSPY